jgi:V/A-type H+-transporting ATPase subunit D
MADQIFPTKANLISAKKSLQLAKQGYELMDRKRNILIREMMQLLGNAKKLQGEIEQVYIEAYSALQMANISSGLIAEIAKTIPEEDGISIRYRSVMGVDIPIVDYQKSECKPTYGLQRTDSQFDIAYTRFNRAKEMTVLLAEVENSIYRIANAITKTSRRANALKNVTIPKFDQMVTFITAALEEKEREEFSRLKVIRHMKDTASAENT